MVRSSRLLHCAWLVATLGVVWVPVPGTAAEALHPAASAAVEPSTPLSPLSSELSATIEDGRMVGLVREGEDGPGIAGVSVRIDGPEERTAVTDADGGFRFELLPAGTYTLHADHLAYEAVEVEVDVSGGDRTTRVEVRLLSEAIALEPLLVEVEARRPTFGPLVAVYERIDHQRNLGLGTILTRDEIEDRVVSRVTDLLRGMAGVRLVPGITGPSIEMRRAAGFGPCPVVIYVDGMKVGRGSPDAFVTPMELEIVEVYRGASQVPPEFSGPEAGCGVVAVWTRRGV